MVTFSMTSAAQPVGGDGFFGDVNDLVKPAAVGGGRPRRAGRESVTRPADRGGGIGARAERRSPGGVRWARGGEAALGRAWATSAGAFLGGGKVGSCEVPSSGGWGRLEGGPARRGARSRGGARRGFCRSAHAGRGPRGLHDHLTVLAMVIGTVAITMAIMRSVGQPGVALGGNGLHLVLPGYTPYLHAA